MNFYTKFTIFFQECRCAKIPNYKKIRHILCIIIIDSEHLQNSSDSPHKNTGIFIQNALYKRTFEDELFAYFVYTFFKTKALKIKLLELPTALSFSSSERNFGISLFFNLFIIIHFSLLI